MHIARDQRTKVVRGSCILEHYSHMCSWFAKSHWGRETATYTCTTNHVQQLCVAWPKHKRRYLKFSEVLEKLQEMSKVVFHVARLCKNSRLWCNTRPVCDTYCKKITLSLLLGTILPSSKTNHQHFIVSSLNRKLICIDWRMANGLGSHTTSPLSLLVPYTGSKRMLRVWVRGLSLRAWEKG